MFRTVLDRPLSRAMTPPLFIVSTISHPLDDLFAEQALRPHQQEGEGDHVGEPALDSRPEERPPIEFADLLADADDHPADDRARYRGEAAEDEHRQRFECDHLERELDLRARS